MAKLSDEKRKFFRELFDCLELELNRAYRDSPNDIKTRVEELRTQCTPLRGALGNLHATLDDNPQVMPLNDEWQWLHACWSRVDSVFDREMKAACSIRTSLEYFRGARIVSYVEFLHILSGKHFFALLKCSELNPLIPVPREDGSCRNTIAEHSISKAVDGCNELLRPFGIGGNGTAPKFEGPGFGAKLRARAIATWQAPDHSISFTDVDDDHAVKLTYDQAHNTAKVVNTLNKGRFHMEASRVAERMTITKISKKS
jgi:hypothetical protein